MNPYTAKLSKIIKDRVVGRSREIDTIISALASGKHVLLEGPPGTSKTTILRVIRDVLDMPVFFVTGNSDLTATKLIGHFDPPRVLSEGYKKENFISGPLVKAMEEGGILYIEEFNRIPEDALNALITAMSERELAVPRLGTIKAKEGFRIVAAMNPYDDIGVGRLSRAILDRFCSVKLEYQSKDEEVEIVKMRTNCPDAWLIEFAVEVVRRTREHPDLKMGASVRGAIDMVMIVQNLERLGYVGLEALKNSAVTALRSKVWLREMAEKDVDEIITDLVLQVFFEKTGIKGRKPEREGGKEREIEIDWSELKKLGMRSRRELIQAIKRVEDEVTHAVLEGNRDAMEIARIAWDKLSDEARKKMAPYLARVLVKKAREIFVRGLKWKTKVGEYAFDSDEICLDTTIEESGIKIITGILEYSDIQVFKKDKARKSIVIMLDKSGSMIGEKIFLAAMVAASIALGVKDHEYAILAFDEGVEYIKRVGETKSVDEIVEKILLLKPYGCTDIALALKKGFEELTASKGKDRVGVILTDGLYNTGENPEGVARQFPRLVVLCPPKGNFDTCEKLAKLGRGEALKLDDRLGYISI
jgi:MoxR-like ATPase